MRHPWLAAILLGTLATPAAVILAVPSPRPLDAILAWPLVLMDWWVGQGRPERLAALLVGIVLTWAHYVVLARLGVWWAVTRMSDDA